ncbi:MAG: protein-(glutamine-N5) methyltransferase, release factor-specific [Gammaproteobacteria bacterium RIFCSPHIGHO2_12_FULL_41_20]|nr:MAG: protein-(glutamine-N5) methyltransferase, release factor-specific [Gammaproteobacteria bacterium RIFCSPHIGHO2_12_FULL_41_20]
MLPVVTDVPMWEAEQLLANVLNAPRSYLYAYPEAVLTMEQSQKFIAVIFRRMGGEPIPYLTGHCEFWALALRVTPDTLIPRPETELLVELLLERLGQDAVVADLGTGSGAVALALATERPQWVIYATDHSPAALAVAQANAQRLGLTQIHFRQGDWCAALAEDTIGCSHKYQLFHAIVSNPPYISEVDWRVYGEGLKFEPRTALVAGERGLSEIKKIIVDGRRHLESGGYIMIEHGFAQGAVVRHLLQQANYQEVATYKDLAGRERVTGGIILGMP